MIAALRRAAPYIVCLCKAVLLVVFAAAVLILAALAPAVFGYRPFVVMKDAYAVYPSGALAYCRYALAEQINAGDTVAVSREDGIAVYTVAERDDTARVFYLHAERGKREKIPFELSEGVVAAVYFPLVGYCLQVLQQPAVCAALSGVVVVLFLGAFLLPKWGYQPKYGRREN